MPSLRLKRLSLLSTNQVRWCMHRDPTVQTDCYAAGMHSVDDNQEEAQDSASRPTNAIHNPLSIRRSSSPFSFVTDRLISSFPYYVYSDRPQTAPPEIRGRSPMERGDRILRSIQSSPARHVRSRTTEYEEERTYMYTSIREEEEEQEEQHQEEEFRDLSQISYLSHSSTPVDTICRG